LEELFVVVLDSVFLEIVLVQVVLEELLVV